MRAYWRSFALSLSQFTTHRLDFLLGRLRNIVTLILLYYVWLAVSEATGKFSSFSQSELVTYVFLANILRSIIFGAQSRRIATEINDGIFSVYLTRPMNHFLIFYFRELAERCVLFVSSILEVIIFALILDLQFSMPTVTITWAYFFLSLFFAHILYYVLSYAINLIAFWSREAMGPRFLFEWFLEFASGAYFPLTILQPIYLILLSSLPFMSVMFVPLMIYLEKIQYYDLPAYIAVQFCWIIATSAMTYVMWKKGLKKYTGEGI